MPIDMDNMLHGFSPQLMSAAPLAIDPNASATYTMAVVPLRDTEVLDFGLIVTGAATATYSVNFGVTKPGVTADGNYFVDTFAVDADTAVGTIYRVEGGSLEWYSEANTEAKRRIPKGSVITVSVTGTAGDVDGEFVPFVMMRGAEPLDPIA